MWMLALTKAAAVEGVMAVGEGVVAAVDGAVAVVAVRTASRAQIHFSLARYTFVTRVLVIPLIFN